MPGVAEIANGGVLARCREGTGQITVETSDSTTRFVLLPAARRVRLGLELEVRRTPIDVSPQPGLLDHTMSSPDRDRIPGDLARTVTQWITAFASTHGAPTVSTALPSVAAAAAAFPVLAHAHEPGRRLPSEIPRWAVEALASPTLRACADLLAGHRVARPLVAAIAGSLLVRCPGQEQEAPSLFGLAAVAMGGGIVDDSRLASILALAPWHDGGDWRSEEIGTFRRLATRVRTDRAAAWLLEAVSLPDGPRRLPRRSSSSAVSAEATSGRCRRPWSRSPPTCGRGYPSVTTSAAAPRTEPRPEPRPRLVRTAAAPQRSDVFASRALAPPVAGGHGARNSHLETPAELRSIHGTVLERGRLRLVVPSSTDTLREWGRRLANCLGSYDEAAGGRAFPASSGSSSTTRSPTSSSSRHNAASASSSVLATDQCRERTPWPCSSTSDRRESSLADPGRGHADYRIHDRLVVEPESRHGQCLDVDIVPDGVGGSAPGSGCCARRYRWSA